MIIGGYTLDLYCDDPRHKALHPREFDAGGASFAGPTKRDCEAQARRRGWKLADEKCFCKVCRNTKEPTP